MDAHRHVADQQQFEALKARFKPLSEQKPLKLNQIALSSDQWVEKFSEFQADLPKDVLAFAEKHNVDFRYLHIVSHSKQMNRS